MNEIEYDFFLSPKENGEKMRKEEIVNKNLDLHGEFMKYTFEHPEILDQIPKGATLVILPEDNPFLYKENLKIIKNQ